MKTLNRPQPVACPPSSWMRALACAIAAMFSVGAMPALAGIDIPDIPLLTGKGSDPNVLYLHDDSGSMYFSFMPDLDKMPSAPFTNPWPCSDVSPQNACDPRSKYGNTPIGSLTEDQSRRLRSPQANALYYNPNIIYEPPPAPPGVAISNASPPGTLGNANFNGAWFDGYDINGRDSSKTIYAGKDGNDNAIPRRVDLSKAFKATYSYGVTFGASLQPGEYLSHQKKGTAAHYYDCPSGWKGSCTGPVYMTTPEQKQNFANWYSYYRTRNLAARAGISRAFVKFGGNVRVGWGKINKSTKNSIDGKSVSTIEQGVRPFTDARKKEFLTWLYTAVPSGNTPLRRALDDAGQYYDRSSKSIGPWADNPENGTGTEAAACRKSFSILMTDGYWNDAMASMATGNHDGQAAATSFTPPKKPDGSAPDLSREPFRDSYSNTLADVAWYYWAKDLLPGNSSSDNSNNKVIGTTRDPAWWQHMTTYTIGLGVAASIADKDAAFLAADTQTRPGFTWPNGANYQIDDLLHAGVNGHGDFFSAADPDEFVRGMQSIIDAISDIVASSGKIASNAEIPGAQGASEALAFKMTYKTEDWSGELTASELNAISGENRNSVGNVVWKASSAMPPASERKIFTRSNGASGVGSTGIEFEWSSLNAQQKLDLQEGDSVAHGRDVLDYLRGSGARENANGGAFRNRYRADATRSPLGDSPNNGMVYDKATATLYLGANDGMLHAFDAATGAERFAYIPSALFPRLSRLADIDYNHEYYVDGEAVIAEAGNQRYLTGALGRGGKGLYGLRVTQPAAFSKDDVLWELNGRASSAQCGSGDNAGILDDLGIVVGRPVVARLASGHTVAIVGNGYNSCQGKASLYIIDVTNGEVLHKVDTPAAGDNGLSTPFAFDHDGDGILTSADAIYAGDLKGNLWRFAEAGGVWRVSFGGAAQAMFTARNAANQTQPITAQPLAAHHPDTGATYVIFGTGQYLQNADKSNLSIQSLYGLIDGNSLPTATRASLRQRNLSFPGEKGTLSDGTNVDLLLVEQAKAGDMDGKRGWFIDFNLAAEPGSRIIGASRIVTGGANGMVLEVPVTVPTSDPCERGGTGWNLTINPFTGAELGAPFFDLNGDGKVDSKDRTSKGRVSAGFRPGASFGMPGELSADGPYGTYGGSSGNTVSTAIDNSKSCKKGSAECISGRIFWREIIRK